VCVEQIEEFIIDRHLTKIQIKQHTSPIIHTHTIEQKMNQMMNSLTIGLVGTICGGLFIGYCIYFDKKRRSDPNYKRKILERRKRQLEEEEKSKKINIDFNDEMALQRFFLEEIELGEEYLRAGDTKECVEHLCRAIAVCPTPDGLISTLQQTIPPQIFLLILQRLPQVGRELFPSGKPAARIRVRPSTLQMDDNSELD